MPIPFILSVCKELELQPLRRREEEEEAKSTSLDANVPDADVVFVVDGLQPTVAKRSSFLSFLFPHRLYRNS